MSNIRNNRDNFKRTTADFRHQNYETNKNKIIDQKFSKKYGKKYSVEKIQAALERMNLVDFLAEESEQSSLSEIDVNSRTPTPEEIQVMKANSKLFTISP